jgi:hypothetical protein
MIRTLKYLLGVKTAQAYCNPSNCTYCGWTHLAAKFLYSCYDGGGRPYSYWGSCQALVIC